MLSIRISALLLLASCMAIVARDAELKKVFETGSSIGLSVEGWLIRQLPITETDASQFIVVLGGQHPPEVAGDHGLVYFVDEICNDSDLSRRFRKEFQIVVVPMINPDGKHHGHWRGTFGGMDSNRDWTNQTLPEIQVVTRCLLDRITEEGGKTWVAVDFHATNRDFFYIGKEDDSENINPTTTIHRSNVSHRCTAFASFPLGSWKEYFEAFPSL